LSKIRVSTPARIHMGILNPSHGTEGRLFGSAGVAVKEPRTIVEVEKSRDVCVSGPFVDECKRLTRKVIKHYGLKGAKVNVLSIPQRHSGLGSTTQLSLSIAKGITYAYGLDIEPVELSKIIGRGEQSATGTYVFRLGGFVVEGGWGEKTVFPPLLFRYAFPEDWRFVIVVPKGRSFDEKQEPEAFEKLPKADERLVHEAGYRLLMGMAPAVAEHDLQAFGRSLSRLQEVVGAMFSQIQGGIFQPHSAPIIEKLKTMGAAGVGQSSWGPSVYALFDSKESQSIEAQLEKEILKHGPIRKSRGNLSGTSEWGEIYFTSADNRGAILTS
jgi:beta-ribofuranosylaminobenzene 5'-phosphate synthase